MGGRNRLAPCSVSCLYKGSLKIVFIEVCVQMGDWLEASVVH